MNWNVFLLVIQLAIFLLFGMSFWEFFQTRQRAAAWVMFGIATIYLAMTLGYFFK